MGADTRRQLRSLVRRFIAGLGGLIVRRPWLTVAVVISLIAAHSWLLKSGIDFTVFYRAGRRFLSGEPLYWAELTPFKYAPAVAVFFAPLSALPEPLARAIWLAISAAAVVRFLQLAAILTHSIRPGLHLAVLVLSLPFIQVLLSWGQCDAVLLLLMLQSEIWADRRPFASGALWALACLFKLPYLLFLAIAGPLRQWRRLGGLALGLMAGMALGTVRYGLRMNIAQIATWRDVLSETTASLFCVPTNQSAFAIVCSYWADPSNDRRFLGGVLALAAFVFLFYALAAVVTWTRDPARGRLLATALALHLTAFLSPLGWRANLLSAAPVIYVLLASRRSSVSWERRLAIVGLIAVASGLLGYEIVGADLFGRLLLGRYLGLGVLVAAMAAGASQIVLAKSYGSAPAFRLLGAPRAYRRR